MASAGINDKKYVEWETAKKWGVYPEGAAVNKGEPCSEN